MSSSKRILKKTQVTPKKEVVYMDEHIHAQEETFLGQTFEKKKQQMEKELAEWRAQEVEKINQQLEGLVQQGYEQGKQTAYQEVFEQVMAENEKKMKHEYDAKVEEARKIYKAANAYLMDAEENIFSIKRKWVERNEEELAEILRLSLEKIVGRAATIASEEIKTMLKETLQESETKNKNIWVRVNPQTKDIIEKKGFSEEQFELVPDPALNINDFIVETDSEWIDATIKNKLISFKKKVKDWIEKNEIFE